MTIVETKETSAPSLLRQLYDLDIERVVEEISPADGMFEHDKAHYFAVGQSALRCIKLAMLAAGKDDFRNILDFGCGFGRVLRILKAAFPQADLTACDISKDAVDFCSKTFGSSPVYSREEISEIHIRGQFDLIWCGTLLTNVDAPNFSRLLELFYSLLAENGMLVFTTHGPYVAHRIRTREFTYGPEPNRVPKMVRDYDDTGFAYEDYPQEVLARLGVRRYGISVSAPAWVCHEISRFPDFHLLTYTERAWDDHQDSIACVKRSW